MRRKLLIGCLGLAAVAVAALAVVVVVLDGKFGLFQAPRTAYSEIAGLNWPLRIVVEPQAIGEQLVERIKAGNANIPNWIADPRVIGQILPREFTILAAPDAAANTLSIAGFVNENRFGPVLEPVLRELPDSLANVNWAPEGLQYPQRGAFIVRGALPLDTAATDYFAGQWTRTAYQPPLETVGGHFVEVLLDNRTGMGFLLTVMSIAATDPTLLVAPDPDAEVAPEVRMAQAQMTFLINSLKKVDALRLYADPAVDDTLAISLDIACDPAAGRSGPETVKTVLDTGLGQLQELLLAGYGIDLQGKTRIEGEKLVGEFTAKPFSAVLAMVIQTEPATAESAP